MAEALCGVLVGAPGLVSDMSRYCQQIEWGDVPHLDDAAKAALFASIPPHQRDARTKGIPILGAGVIYPVPDDLVICEPFELPEFWPRAYGLDPDWNRTAALWGAWDRESDIVYCYSEYFSGQQPPSVHADAIKRRGEWMAGAVDPSAAGKISPKDGSRLLDEYRELGLNLIAADNAVEAGIFACYQRQAAGRLKIFRSCTNTIAERRIYRRVEKQTENGTRVVIVKDRDDLMDAMRYLIMTGMQHASTEPRDMDDYDGEQADRSRSSVTGY